MSCPKVDLKKSLNLFILTLALSIIGFFELPAQNRDGIPGPTLLYPPNQGPHLTPPILTDWQDVPYARKYQIQVCREDTLFTNPEIDEETINSEYLIDTLEGAHYIHYYWHVRAQLTTYEWTDWSETWHILSFCLVEGPRPLEPPNDAIMQSEMVSLKWEGVIGSYGYDIWFDDDPLFGSPECRLEVIDPYLEISLLLPGTTYYWRTLSWHECVARFSDVWSFTTCTPLPAPELISPPENAENLGIPVELTWNESPYSSVFQLQIATTSDFVDPIYGGTVEGTSYLCSDVDEGVTYYWRLHLMADDPCGYENWSHIQQFTTDIPFVCGDADDNGLVNILDIIFIINFKYKSGPEPFPLESADVNSDEDINIMDIVYLLNNIYKFGPDPVCQ